MSLTDEQRKGRDRDVFARLKTDFGQQQFEGPTGSTGGIAHLLFT